MKTRPKIKHPPVVPPPSTGTRTGGSADKSPTPWGYSLWKHMNDAHGLILTEDELRQIIHAAAPFAGVNDEMLSELEHLVTEQDPEGKFPEFDHTRGLIEKVKGGVA